MSGTEILGGLTGLFIIGCMGGMSASVVLCALIFLGYACYANLDL